MSQKSPSRLLALTGAAFLAVPLATLMPSQEASKAIARWEDSTAREQRNSSAIAIMLGEFRANLSDMLFVKTERYLHTGVAYMPHIDTDALASTGQTEHAHHDHDHETSGTSALPQGHHEGDGHDHHHHDATTDTLAKSLEVGEMTAAAGLKPGQTYVEKEAENVPTIIKTEDRDFRGFLGSIERQVKPWRDPRMPHQHTAGTELLPWFRMATLGNPGNERAYLIGAWWLKTLQSDTQKQEGLKFIEEGVANNPKSFTLHLMRGYLLRDLGKAREASGAFRKAAEFSFTVRPEGGKIGNDWTVSREEMASAAWTMAVLSARDEESTSVARALAAEYLKKSGNAPTVQRVLDGLKD